MNLFDGLKAMVVQQVANTMGYAATWMHNGQPQTGQVLFKSATDKDPVSDTAFQYFDYQMEYQAPLFADLKKLVDEAQVIQEISIVKNGEATVYLVQEVQSKFDGDVYVAMLRKKEV